LTAGLKYDVTPQRDRLQGRVTLEELLDRFPNFAVDPDRARYAPGPFVRRFESLPIRVRA